MHRELRRYERKLMLQYSAAKLEKYLSLATKNPHGYRTRLERVSPWTSRAPPGPTVPRRHLVSVM